MSEFIRLDRNWLVAAAQRSQDAASFERVMTSTTDEIGKRAVMLTRSWGIYGYQSVLMPHTYAAALMATDAKNAIAGEALPWPAFEIQVPGGTLSSDHGEIFSILVSIPPPGVIFTGGIKESKIFLGYLDSISTGSSTYLDLEHMFANEHVRASGTYVPEALLDLYDNEREARLWQMITRLVAGVVLAINMAKDDKPTLFAAKPVRMKRDRARPNVHQLGHVLDIDCRQAVRSYIEGDRRHELNVSTWVRGHWRKQAYGPQHSLRRRQWILPFQRGKGPLLVRPTRIKEPSHEP